MSLQKKKSAPPPPVRTPMYMKPSIIFRIIEYVMCCFRSYVHYQQLFWIFSPMHSFECCLFQVQLRILWNHSLSCTALIKQSNRNIQFYHISSRCVLDTRSLSKLYMNFDPPPLKPCILPFIASLFDVPIGSGSKRRQSTLQLVRSVPSRVGGSRFIDFSIETYSFRIWF